MICNNVPCYCVERHLFVLDTIVLDTFGLGVEMCTGWMDMGVLDTDPLVPAGKFALTLTFCKVNLTLVGLMST